jgi:hypothetical protein
MLIFASLSGACGNSRPTSPTPVPTSLPTPTPQAPGRYSVSGVVTDDAGAGVEGAHVGVGYMPTPTTNKFVGTTSDSSGRFQLEFETTSPLQYLPSAVGHIVASANGYDHSQQILPWGTRSIVKVLVIRQALTITAGDSAAVTVDANSSICSDLEDWFIPDRQCGQIHVVAPMDGTLTIDARPFQDAAAIPVVFSATSGDYRRQVRGPGTVTLLEVQAGRVYHIFVGSPAGVASQTYVVSTSQQGSDP